VCYAEKTHGSFILPHIARAKSPQQVMGSFVKEYLAKEVYKVPASRVYHVTIMPCFDKKLEASRSDFATKPEDSEEPVKDVDCVLTSSKMRGSGMDFRGKKDSLKPTSKQNVPIFSQAVKRGLILE
jgi:iron only hydrogenase large subunit-like protein